MRSPNHAKKAVAWPKTVKTHNLPRLIWAGKVSAARIILITAISQVTRLLRRPNHAVMAVVWPKSVKTHNLPRLIRAGKSSRGANFFHPSHFPRYTSLTASQPRKKAVAGPKTVRTHNLPRSIRAGKSSRGANFFHPSHFPRYTSLTASQPRKNGRCLDQNSQNTQFATFNLGCKIFARRELFSSQPFPTLHVFYGVPNTQKWPLPGQKQSKHTMCHV